MHPGSIAALPFLPHRDGGSYDEHRHCRVPIFPPITHAPQHMATVRHLPNFLKYSLERVLPTSLEALQRDYDALLVQPSEARGTTDVDGNAASFKPDILYGRKEAAAYTAFRFGPVFSVQEHIYGELKERLPEFRPKRVLDFGAGPGQTCWAVNYAFDDNGDFAKATEDQERERSHERSTKDPEHASSHAPSQADSGAIHFTCVEESMAMQDIGKELCRPLKHLSRCVSWYPSIRDVFEKGRSDYDMAVVSYTLDDMTSANAQNAAVQLCWEKLNDDGVLVVIEKATPEGFGAVSRVRDAAIAKDEGGKGARRGSASHLSLPGADVVAPCTHMEECPMAWGGAGAGDMVCRFPIRVETPYSAYYKVEYFSYLILRKNGSGDRSALFRGLATDVLDVYGRAVHPPRKRKSHVILDLCTNRGELETLTITKKYNRILPMLYRRSRKLKWGGLWPDLSPKQRVNRDDDPDDDPDEDEILYTI